MVSKIATTRRFLLFLPSTSPCGGGVPPPVVMLTIWVNLSGGTPPLRGEKYKATPPDSQATKVVASPKHAGALRNDQPDRTRLRSPLPPDRDRSRQRPALAQALPRAEPGPPPGPHRACHSAHPPDRADRPDPRCHSHYRRVHRDPRRPDAQRALRPRPSPRARNSLQPRRRRCAAVQLHRRVASNHHHLCRCALACFVRPADLVPDLHRVRCRHLAHGGR